MCHLAVLHHTTMTSEASVCLCVCTTQDTLLSLPGRDIVGKHISINYSSTNTGPFNVKSSSLIAGQRDAWLLKSAFTRSEWACPEPDPNIPHSHPLENVTGLHLLYVGSPPAGELRTML